MVTRVKIRHHIAVATTGIQVSKGCPKATDKAMAGLAGLTSEVRFQGIISTNQGAIPSKMKDPKTMSRGIPMAKPRPLAIVLNMIVRVRKNNRFSIRIPNIATYQGTEKALPVAKKVSR